ncbi:hypothetical protein ABZT03_19075 [Streptomyces sp. NPDC005574]|uniref:hypothetical protein n=1 Tax=Streptomyces sp. NPDC005574 TaxID=3156891 RepID=UPI0033BE3FAA
MFVATLVLLYVSAVQGWAVLTLLCGVVLIGVMVTTAARRQQSGGRTPGGGERPWRRRD